MGSEVTKKDVNDYIKSKYTNLGNLRNELRDQYGRNIGAFEARAIVAQKLAAQRGSQEYASKVTKQYEAYGRRYQTEYEAAIAKRKYEAAAKEYEAKKAVQQQIERRNLQIQTPIARATSPQEFIKDQPQEFTPWTEEEREKGKEAYFEAGRRRAEAGKIYREATPDEVGEYGKQEISRLNLEKLREKAGTKEAPGFFESVGREAKLFSLSAGREVVETGKLIFTPEGRAGVAAFATSFVTKPWETTTSTIKSAFTTLKQTGPSELAGGLAGGFALQYGVVKGVGFAAQKISDVRITYGATQLPEEQVFSRQVLKEGKTFPTTKTSQEVVEQFSKADEVVTTASPAKIGGTEAGAGARARAGLEDTGIYTTPAGEGSPYFLGVEAPTTEFRLSILPSVKKPTRPTVARFQTEGITQIPKEQLLKKGFKELGEYTAENIAPTGKVYVSKRSMIGKGEIPSSGFAGTTETELIIPTGTKFEFIEKAPKQYTTYKGRKVAIDEYRTVATKADDVASTGVDVADVQARQKLASSYDASSIGTTKEVSYSPTPSVIKTGSSQVSQPTSQVSYTQPTSQVSTTTPISSTTSTSTSKIKYAGYYPVADVDYSNLYKPTSTSNIIPSGSSPTPPPTSSPTYTPVSGGSSYYSTALREQSTSYYETPKFKFSRPEKREKKVELFIRREGKFKSAGIYKESQVLREAQRKVGTSAAASFRLQDPFTKKIITKPLPSPDFYVSKKEAGVFIERRGRRIKSSGELRDITFKGIATQKRRSIWNRK